MLLKTFFKRFKHEYQNSDFDMELIFDNGRHRFYTYKNPIQLPYKRTEAALTYSRYAQMCITNELLKSSLDALIIANNKGDKSMVGHIANNLIINETHYGERNSLLNLATVYCVLEGEPCEKYIQSWQDKKLKIWQDDEDCRDFFLIWAYKKVPSFMTAQKDIILNYLANQQSKNLILKHLVEETLLSSSKQETK